MVIILKIFFLFFEDLRVDIEKWKQIVIHDVSRVVFLPMAMRAFVPQ